MYVSVKMNQYPFQIKKNNDIIDLKFWEMN